MHQGAQYIQGSTAGLTVPSAVPLTVGDLEVEGECTVQHASAAEPSVQPDLSEPVSPLIDENAEIAELRANLDRRSHATCDVSTFELSLVLDDTYQYLNISPSLHVVESQQRLCGVSISGLPTRMHQRTQPENAQRGDVADVM